jgi:integral membrane sensor domain MASE1
MSFRAAVRGFSEEETGEALVTPLHRGILGAFVGFLVIVALLIFFGAEGQRLLAHSLGRRSSGFTTLRMLTAAVLLGFGTGFVTGIRRAIQS